MNVKKLIKNLILILIFVFAMSVSSFAAKYTMCSGKEFNARVKYALNKNGNSVEKTVLEFRRNFDLPEGVTLIDISEDSDSSVLAYVENDILYYVCEDEVYFNADMSYMFEGFFAIQKIDLHEFEFKKCKKTNYMFANCIDLTNIDLDNDTDIELSEMEGMFYNCQSLVNLYIPMLITKSVKSFKDLFNECRNLKNIEVDKEKFITKNAKDYSGIFKNCYMLKTNYGRNATSISENNYSIYLKTGDDDTEGLLKDFNFEYDDYGNDNENYIVDTYDNISFNDISLSNNELTDAKKHFNVRPATDSSLISVSGKNSNQLSNDDVEAILMAETTYVPDLEERIRQFNEKRNKSLDYGLEEEETFATESNVEPTFTPGRLTRPSIEDYANLGLEEKYSSYQYLDNTIFIVIIVILLVVIFGLYKYIRKTKKENKEIDSPYDDF